MKNSVMSNEGMCASVPVSEPPISDRLQRVMKNQIEMMRVLDDTYDHLTASRFNATCTDEPCCMRDQVQMIESISDELLTRALIIREKL